MPDISEEQLRVFNQHAMTRFRDQLFVYFKAQFPDQTLFLGDEQLNQFIQNGIIQAKNFNIHKESDIRRYLEYALTKSGSNNPVNTRKIQTILSNPALDGTRKMDQLEQFC